MCQVCFNRGCNKMIIRPKNVYNIYSRAVLLCEHLNKPLSISSNLKCTGTSKARTRMRMLPLLMMHEHAAEVKSRERGETIDSWLGVIHALILSRKHA